MKAIRKKIFDSYRSDLNFSDLVVYLLSVVAVLRLD